MAYDELTSFGLEKIKVTYCIKNQIMYKRDSCYQFQYKLFSICIPKLKNLKKWHLHLSFDTFVGDYVKSFWTLKRLLRYCKKDGYLYETYKDYLREKKILGKIR